MRLCTVILTTSILLSGLSGSEYAAAQVADEVGTVIWAEETSRLERQGSEIVDPITEDSQAIVGVNVDDSVVSDLGALLMSLDLERETKILVRDGSITITRPDELLVCEVTGTVMFERKAVMRRAATTCDVLAGGVNFRHRNTKFLVAARGIDTSLFVMEGSVEVSSANPDIPGARIVKAGEWLIARRDEAIPKPLRYRRSDIRSGSSECIYSNCKLTDKVPIPPPPVYTPQVLVPPPLNPPGRR